jgi:hypothetical protein
VIDMAFKNWPESHSYQPADKRQLRGWLACRVGHYVTIRLNGIRGLNKDTARDLLKAFTENVVYFETDDDRNGTFVIKPRTMKKAELRVQEFRTMANNVYHLLHTVCGITPEVYKANKDKAA